MLLTIGLIELMDKGTKKFLDIICDYNFERL